MTYRPEWHEHQQQYPCRHGFMPEKCLSPCCEHYPERIRVAVREKTEPVPDAPTPLFDIQPGLRIGTFEVIEKYRPQYRKTSRWVLRCTGCGAKSVYEDKTIRKMKGSCQLCAHKERVWGAKK